MKRKRPPTVCGECRYRREDLADASGHAPCFLHPATASKPNAPACKDGERR